MFFLLLLLVFGTLQAQSPALVEKSNRAKALMSENKFAEAAALYGELSQAVPNNPGLLLNLGMALQMSGADLKAIAPLEAALKLNPNIPPARLFLGASYLRTNQPAKALPHIEKLIAIDPENTEARQMAIDAATGSGQIARATPHLEKLGLWYELGRTYEALASQSFTQLEKLYPESGPFFALLAASRNQSSQSRAAFFFYRKALEKSPDLRGMRTAIAAIYRANGNPEWALHEEAIEARLPALECKPVTAECEFAASRYTSVLKLARTTSLPDLYWRTKAYRELAGEAFRRLTQLPPSPDSLRYQAETARAQSRHADAAEAWRAALKLAPGNPEFLRELASTLMTLKDYDEAQKITTQLLAKEPKAPDLNELQGQLYLAQQLPEKAEPFLAKAVAVDPRHLRARAALARAMLAQGKAKEALPHVTAALPIDTDGSLHIQLARAYQALGLEAESKSAMMKYQAIQLRLKEQDKVLEEEVTIKPPQ